MYPVEYLITITKNYREGLLERKKIGASCAVCDHVPSGERVAGRMQWSRLQTRGGGRQP